LLGAVALALGGTDTVSDVAHALIDTLCPALADACEVVVPGIDGLLWRVAAGPGDMSRRGEVPVPDLDDHPLRRAALHGERSLVDVDDPASARLLGPADEPTSARALGIEQALVVPMVARRRPVGALALGLGPSKRRFGPHDEDLVVRVAGLAAVAIENAQLSEQQRRVIERLRSAGTVGAALAAAEQVRVVAEVLVTLARDELGASHGTVRVIDGDELVVLAARGHGRAAGREGDRVPLDEPSPVTEALHAPSPSTWLTDADRSTVLTRITDDGHPAAVACWTFDRARRFSDADRSFVALVAEQASAAISRIRAQAAESEAVQRLREQQAELLDSRARLNVLADAGVVGIISGEGERIREANAAFLGMLGLDLETARSTPWTAMTPPEWEATDRAVVDEMLTKGRAEPFEKEYLHADGRRVPVLVGGVTLSREPFRWSVFVIDVSARREAERSAALAREQLEELLERQRTIAQTLQTSLLPEELPSLPGFELGVQYWPAVTDLDVGGDLYDAFPLGEGRWGLLVGDVCGKGVEAAAVTATARHSLRAAALHIDDPARVLRWVHDAIVVRPKSTFCTMAYAVLDLRDEVPALRVSLGGHEPGFVISADGTVHDVGEPGTLLGAIVPTLHTAHRRLEPGDLVAFYTDGITDAPGDEAMPRDELGSLLADARDLPLESIGARVRATLARRRPRGSRDDVALLLLRHVGEPGAAR